MSGMAGQALTLECDANGFPAPEITWFKDGQLVGVPWGGPGRVGLAGAQAFRIGYGREM